MNDEFTPIIERYQTRSIIMQGRYICATQCPTLHE